MPRTRSWEITGPSRIEASNYFFCFQHYMFSYWYLTSLNSYFHLYFCFYFFNNLLLLFKSLEYFQTSLVISFTYIHWLSCACLFCYSNMIRYQCFFNQSYQPLTFFPVFSQGFCLFPLFLSWWQKLNILREFLLCLFRQMVTSSYVSSPGKWGL